MRRPRVRERELRRDVRKVSFEVHVSVIVRGCFTEARLILAAWLLKSGTITLFSTIPERDEILMVIASSAASFRGR
jgi:hypothetical protein